MSDTEIEIMRARLVDVNHNTTILKRQIPVEIGEGSELVLQFGDSDMLNTFLEIAEDKPEHLKEFQSFIEKIKILDDEELKECLKSCYDDMINLLSTLVSCVGCRRAVESLFQLVSEMDFRTLCPIKLKKYEDHQTSREFTLEDEYLKSLKRLFMILYVFKPRLEWVVNVIPKSRKSKRCNLHCLDSHKVKSIGVWMDFWKSLNISSRDEIVTINIDAFVEALDSYLQKHRFCQECKAKVERAYKLLLNEASPENEEDYDGEIFSGIKVCTSDGHLHIDSADETISGLISRAEPELTNSSRRERHAKTMDVAQEEVLTCLGIVLHEKLHKICQKVKAEEQTWMILVNTCLECLKRRLVLTIEEKRGYSNMDLFLLEHEEETKKKEMKKEIKREKKRKKKLARKTTSEGASDTCSHSPSKDDFGFDEEDEEEAEREEREENDEYDIKAKKLAENSKLFDNLVYGLTSPSNSPKNQQQGPMEDTTESSDEKNTDWQVVENNHCKQCSSRKSSRSQRTLNGKFVEGPNSPNSIRHLNNNAHGWRYWEPNPMASTKRKSKSNSDVSAPPSSGSCCRATVAARHPLKPTEKNTNSQPQRNARPPNNKVPTSVNNNVKRQHCSRLTPSSVSSSALLSSNQSGRVSTPCQVSCSTENSSSESCSRPRPPNGRHSSQLVCCKDCERTAAVSGSVTSSKCSKNKSEGSKATENKRTHRLESSGSYRTLSRALVNDSCVPEYSSVSTSEETEVGEDFITEQERIYFQDNWAEIREQRDLLRSKLRQAWTEKTKAIS